MIIKNERLVKALNWLNTTGKWISVDRFLQTMMLGIIALVSLATVKFVPSYWDWSVVVTQGLAFAVGAMCVGDHIHRHTAWHYKNPVIYAWFSTDSSKQWFYNGEGCLNTFTISTLKLMQVLCISLKYNAIALAVIGILYAAVEMVKSITWDIRMLYVVGALVALVLVMCVVVVVFSKTMSFYRFCRDMIAINRIINKNRKNTWVTRQTAVTEWKRDSDRLRQLETRFATDHSKPKIEDILAASGKIVLAASFHIKPPGESASRETLRDTSLQLDELGRSLVGDKQASDAHLFQVRQKHEESKKPAKKAVGE